MRVLPILLYHCIDTECSSACRRWMVSPDLFARHLGLLADNGYHPITLQSVIETLEANEELPEKTVVLTFDDGLRDFGKNALPILERFGFPATLFVVTGHVGGTATWLHALGEGSREMLGWSDLNDVIASGVELGAHTRTHPQLDLISLDMAREEIAGSKQDLENALGREVVSFAYPHGYATPAIRRIVGEAGFKCACRVRNALASSEENRFALSRIIITEAVDDAKMMNLLEGEMLPVAPPTDRLLADGWRLVRRVGHLVGAMD